MAKTVYEILVELEGDLQLKSSMAIISQQTAALGREVSLAGQQILELANVAREAATEYETALFKVGTILGRGKEGIAEFDAALKEQLESLGFAASLTEAATSAYQNFSSGITEINDVIGLQAISIDLATGGFTDLISAGDTITTVYASFKDSIDGASTELEKFQIIADQAAKVQDLGRITVGQYSTQIGKVAAAAQGANVSLEELNGAIAQATFKGLTIESTFAGVAQVIQSIVKPTQEATELIALTNEELRKTGQAPIEFDSVALEARGLVGVLEELERAGLTTSSNLGVLFGSVEALRVAQNLTGKDLEGFKERVEAVGDSFGQASKAAELMAETTEVKTRNALNRLNAALIELGQGVLIALTPVLESLTFLIEKFNELPAPVKESVGLIIALSGGVISLGGALLILTASMSGFIIGTSTAASSIGAMSIAAKGAAASLTTFTATQFTATTGATGLAATIAGVTVALSALVIQLGFAIAAFKSLQLAWEQYKNIRIQEQAAKVQSAIKQQDGLVKSVEKTILKMRETGEALPEDQYKEYIRLLKEASTEEASLQGFVDALTEAQNRNTKSVEGNNEATTKATLSLTQLKKAEEAFLSARKNTFKATESQLEATIAKTQAEAATRQITEQEASDKILATEKDLAQKRIAFIEELIASEKTLSTTKVQLAKEAETIRKDIAQKELQAFLDTQERKVEALRVANNKEIDLALTLQAKRGDTEANLLKQQFEARTKFNNELIKLKQDQLNSELLSEGQRLEIDGDITRLIKENAQELAKFKADMKALEVRTQRANLSKLESEVRTSLNNQILTETEAQEKIAQIREDSSRRELARLRAERSQTLEGSVERLEIEASIAREIESISKIRQDSLKAEQKILEETVDKSKALAETRKARVELEFNQGNLDFTSFTNGVRQVEDEINKITLDSLQRRIELAKEGTTERVELEREFAQEKGRISKLSIDRQEEDLEFELAIIRQTNEQALLALDSNLRAKEISLKEFNSKSFEISQNQLRDEISILERKKALFSDGSQKRLEIQTQLAKKLAQIEKNTIENTEKSLGIFLDNLKVKVDSVKSKLELINESASLDQSRLSGLTNFYSGIAGLLQNIASEAGKENINQQKKTQLLGVQRRIFSELAKEGLKISQTGDIERDTQQAIAAIEIQKLRFKAAQLAIEKEQLKVSTQIKQLELEGTIEENKAKLESGTLSESEAKQAELAIDIAARKLTLLEKEEAIRRKNLELQERLVGLEQTTRGAISGINVPNNPIPINNSGQPSSLPDRSPVGNTNSGFELVSSLPQKINEGLASSITPVVESVQAQTVATQAVLASTDGSLSELTKGNTIAGNTLATSQQSLEALSGLSERLDKTLESLNSLPGKIAAVLPRPAPPPRNTR